MIDPEDAHNAIEELHGRVSELEELVRGPGIAMAERDSINGIWMQAPATEGQQPASFPLISIYGEQNSGGRKVVIGLAPNASQFMGGYPFAIIATENSVQLQVRNELGETKHYSLDALARALEHHGG